MITQLKTILKNKVKKNQGLGAFNTFNLEISAAIISASAFTKLPLLIQLTPKSLDYDGPEVIISIINKLAEARYPKSLIAIHLDHGKDFAIIKKCIDLGFSSVHFDGSLLPFNKNILLTKKVVQYAHHKKVIVQGEVGVILGKEGLIKLNNKAAQAKFLTDPAKAKEFVSQTGVDTLAISVGSLHGLYSGQEKLDFPRIKLIKKKCPQTPLVLHGASGVSVSDLKKAIDYGLTIFNLDTVLRLAFTNVIKKTISKNSKLIDPRIYLNSAQLAVRKVVIDYQKILNNKN